MPKLFSRHKLAHGIFLVRFHRQYDLAATFLRFQEHYESSRFRGRIFSLEAYMDWYASRFGAFTYLEDWSGFNVPSTAFRAFCDGRFDPLLRKEQRLIDAFRAERGPFYVIGVASDQDLRHELAHALFNTREDYRKAVLDAMRPHDLTAMKARLAKLGYHREVLSDEAHAYLVAPAGSLKPETRRLARLRAELRRIFRLHASGLSLPKAQPHKGRRKHSAR